MLIRYQRTGLFLSVYVDDIKLAVKKQNINPMWKILVKDVELGEPTSFLDHVFFSCTHRECETSKDVLENTEICSNPGFLLDRWKNFQFPGNRIRIFPHGPMTWKVMQRNVWKEIANWQRKTQQLYKVATPCIDDHQFKEEEMGSVQFAHDCSEMCVFDTYWRT